MFLLFILKSKDKMEKQTKTLLGLGAIAVALYLIFKPKGANAQTPTGETPKIMCNDGQMVLDVPHSETAKFADPCLNHGGQFAFDEHCSYPYIWSPSENKCVNHGGVKENVT
jgi:hypothetical protein